MTIIPASRLSRSDMQILGNNVRPAVRRARNPLVNAVNRSLMAHDEAVDELAESPAAFDDQDVQAVA